MTKSVALKESNYNLKIKLKNGRFLLYNSLSRSLGLMEKEDVEAFEKITNGDIKFDTTHGFQFNPTLQGYCDQGFVVPDHLDEFEYVKKFYGEQRFNSKAINFTICPTMACNFGCDYCFQGADKSVQVMSEEVKEAIINMFLKLLDEKPDLKHVQFIWYGGEPLIKKKIIYELADRLIEIATNRGLSYNANMVSNGYLMNQKVAQEMYDRGLRTVQITLDGAEEYHDTRRALLSNKGTYKKILGNIEEWINEIPIHVNIRVNIDERNKDGIFDLMDDLVARGLSEKKNFTMYFSPVESTTIGCHNVADKMMKKLNYGQLEAELYRYAFQKGLTDIPYPPSFLGICSALREYDFIMVPNGDIHKCWDTVSFPEKRIGSVFDLDSVLHKPNPVKDEWDSFDPFANDICSSCKLLPNCVSYCAHKFIHAEDSAGEATLPCPSIKYSINERLVLKAEMDGFITKEDYDRDEIKTDPYKLTPKMHTIESMKKIKLSSYVPLPVLESSPV